MADFGLTASGFLLKTLTQIRVDLQSAVRSALGASMDVGDRSIIGQILGILAEAIALVWELAEAVNSSQDPDKATGAALEAICALTGTFRTPASRGTVNLLVSGDTGLTVPAGSTVRTASTQQIFALDVDVTIVIGVAWFAVLPYATGTILERSGQVYYAIQGGTSGGTGPTHSQRPYDMAHPERVSTDGGVTYTDTTDGTIIWVWLSSGGGGAATVSATAQESGVVVAAAGDLSEIVSPVSGWRGVFNPSDAIPGHDQDTDAQLRVLREAELAGDGNSPIDAIRSDLLRLPNVTAVRVFMNTSDVTDGDGMPPHSVEALVQGGTDQTIWNQILASIAAGIATTGNAPGTATDSQGTIWPISFSRPQEVPIYVVVHLIKDPLTYAGDDAVKDAVATLDDGQVVGRDAVSSRVVAAVFGVDGVLDVTVAHIDDAPAPTLDTTIPITLRQLATFSTSRTTVVSVDGVP